MEISGRQNEIIEIKSSRVNYIMDTVENKVVDWKIRSKKIPRRHQRDKKVRAF